MMVLITYDVSTTDLEGKKRLRRVAKVCEDYGQRVQYSIFECLIDPGQLVLLKDRLLNIIDKDKDSLRIYHLGANWKRRVEHFGCIPYYHHEEPIIL
ncbi:MAG: CRISPR-associated endonuclease Cas2 [Firmicutes bacterium]|nr:CRISPR-associated endonuclease Cas2 [Bacillota bacterium]